MTVHEHDWRPLVGWIGRYRCATCGAIGFKRLVRAATPLDAQRPDEIKPYICTVAGCARAAVRRKPKQVCSEHAGKVRK